MLTQEIMEFNLLLKLNVYTSPNEEITFNQEKEKCKLMPAG